MKRRGPRHTGIDHTITVGVLFHPRIIKTFRLSMGLTQKDVADYAGVHSVTIAKIESGKIRLPSVDLVNKIGDCLNVKFWLDYNALRKP